MTHGPLSELRAATYRKSSHSTSTGDCVAVGRVGQWIGVRDTKMGPSGPVLAVPRSSWAAFVAAVKV
ncbi:DUF397 domain-containing protein [Pseudonocardia spinosispora]|uniref:DUF397 domain-containing protein n=1 Tax=Pseudonocardia spinosispora TaxID=103441 RepID=UPI0009FBE852|nr:DUF397 domain-containing protein [Pseudonocardia spinosispora]